MKQRLLILAAAVVALGFLSGPVQAHHGGAAFDQSQSLTFSGTVTQLEFANPHVLVYFDVVKDGVTVARAGWTKRTLEPGDKIEIAGTPHKGGSHILQIRKLAGPDGKELPLSEN